MIFGVQERLFLGAGQGTKTTKSMIKNSLYLHYTFCNHVDYRVYLKTIPLLLSI